jgi:hypothetical protein
MQLDIVIKSMKTQANISFGRLKILVKSGINSKLRIIKLQQSVHKIFLHFIQLYHINLLMINYFR